jgi:hypothetical protein
MENATTEKAATTVAAALTPGQVVYHGYRAYFFIGMTGETLARINKDKDAHLFGSTPVEVSTLTTELKAVEVGTGVTEHGYSDSYPFEVVAVSKSGKTLTIRPLDAEFDKSVDLTFLPGGFSAHCANQHDQKWILTSNPNNPTQKIRLTKKGWTSGSYRRFSVGKASKFYDYNF